MSQLPPHLDTLVQLATLGLIGMASKILFTAQTQMAKGEQTIASMTAVIGDLRQIIAEFREEVRSMREADEISSLRREIEELRERFHAAP